VVISPFLLMAVAMTLGSMLGPADAAPRRRREGALAVGLIVLAMVIAAWWFYPIWTGEAIPYDSWRMRMWFSTWI
jgi:dolichyl-phosphate-mannose--protein O-mannosyl transferase